MSAGIPSQRCVHTNVLLKLMRGQQITDQLQTCVCALVSLQFIWSSELFATINPVARERTVAIVPAVDHNKSITVTVITCYQRMPVQHAQDWRISLWTCALNSHWNTLQYHTKLPSFNYAGWPLDNKITGLNNGKESCSQAEPQVLTLTIKG